MALPNRFKITFKTASLLFASFLISSLPVKASFAGTPIDISQTNIQSNKFTISWVTDVEETCQINYGTTPSFGKIAYDDRGKITPGKTHHVTITGLSPNTQYYYEILSDSQTYRNNGAPYTISTSIVLSPPSGSHAAYGQVLLSSGGPAIGAIVVLRVEDKDGIESLGTSQTLSALTNSAGWWSFELNSIRTQDLSNYFSFSASGDSVLISARADRYGPTAMIIDTAEDSPASQMTLGWLLNMKEMPWYKNEKSYYTGAAACQMILNYIRQGPGVTDVTQNEIYNYAHPCPDTKDLTPDEANTALGRFDPYDSLISNSYDTYDSLPDGNPYQGYNFSVDAYNASEPDAINCYMRDICHWMAFTVTKEEWWKKGDLVARPNTPAAVPIFGDTQGYNHWAVVKGAAISNNPSPAPLKNPWNTPDFTIYGLWIKDPLVSGIGENKYVIADECRNTYFKPLNTSDSYNGMYIQIAELPAERSKAVAALAAPVPDPGNIVLIKIALGEPNPTPYVKPKKKDLNWKNIIDPSLLTDDEAVEAFVGTSPGRPIFVQRLDINNGDYYLIPYLKKAAIKIGRTQYYRNLVSGVMIIDAKNGYFKEASWMKASTNYIVMSKGDAIWLLKRSLKRLFDSESIKASLVWEPGNISSSPYKPFWKIEAGGGIWYVSHEAKIYEIKKPIDTKQPEPI